MNREVGSRFPTFRPAWGYAVDGESDLHVEELVRRFQEGDGEALCELFDRYEGPLYRRIQRHLPPHLRRRVSIADIVQESRVVALDRHRDFEARGEDAFRRWVLGIAEKKARRAVQRHLQVGMRAADKEVTRTNRPDTGRFATALPSPSEVAMGEELEQMTRAALASLPPDYQEVLRLCGVEHSL